MLLLADRLSFVGTPQPPASAADASMALAPEVLATATRQSQVPGNDRVPGVQGDDDDGDNDDDGVTIVPLLASTVISDTFGPAGPR